MIGSLGNDEPAVPYDDSNEQLLVVLSQVVEWLGLIHHDLDHIARTLEEANEMARDE